MESIIDQLLNRGDTWEIIKKAQLALEKEEQKREAFYGQINEQEKVEFFRGKIIIHSPVKKRHAAASNALNHLLDTYVQVHGLGFVGHEKVMVRLMRSDFEPDICFFESGKVKEVQADDSLFPVPDFVVEVLSPKTESYDRTQKLEEYALNEVPEYWIIDPQKEEVEQYVLENKSYALQAKKKDGRIASCVIEGFEIEVEAIFHKEKYLEALRGMLEGG